MLTETNIRNAYAYCCQDITLIEHYEEALNDDKKYVCHHKNGIDKSSEQLKEEGLYFHRPACELIFLSISEHNNLHKKGKHHTEETRKKMSDALKGEKNPFYGKHHTEETRKKISDNHADFKGEKHPMYGRHHTDEAKQKVSKANKGKYIGAKHPNAKPCTINGITYGSITDAHKALYPNITYDTFLRKYKNNKL